MIGVAFIGEENADNMRTIAEFSKAKILGRLPWLEMLTPEALRESFLQNFQKDDFMIPENENRGE